MDDAELAESFRQIAAAIIEAGKPSDSADRDEYMAQVGDSARLASIVHGDGDQD